MKIPVLENWSIINNKILTGYVDDVKVSTRPLVSRKGVDQVTDKDGSKWKLGQQYTGVTAETPEKRSEQYLADAVIERYTIINSLPGVKRASNSN